MKHIRGKHTYRNRRRGVTAPLVVVVGTVILAFSALTIDVGLMYNTRAELQRTADAAALAGAMRLMNPDRLKGSADLAAAIADARVKVGEYAGYNNVHGDSPEVMTSDIVVGYLSNPFDASETPAFDDPSRFNAVSARVRRDDTGNGPIELLFARIFGRQNASMTANATAAAMDGIEGFRVTDTTGSAGLMPFALRLTAWQNLLNLSFTTGDNYSYDADTGTVANGSDGVFELNLYPGGGAGQLPPGNFGTVDIGSPNNSTADLSRQIRYGVNADDLSWFGGELRLGPDGTLQLNGDTGLSAGIKDDLAAIIGQPRSIPLFTTVTGPGNNSMYTIVGFAGVRIMSVKLTGSMNSKHLIIQPAIVVDDSVLVGPASGSSYFVYQPVRIVR